MEIFIEVDKKKAELLSLGHSPEAKRKLDKKFRLEWSFHSNHMEGNTLTYGETQMLLFFGKAIGDHEKREYDEMEAHDVAVKMVEEWAKDPSRDLTETDIRQLNKIILVRPFWKEAITPDGQPTRKQIIPGDYKSSPNSVRLKNGEIHEYASPDETPFMMTELINSYHNSVTSLQHAIITAAWFHHRFVSIHPFDDGNGRVARLLANFILLRNSYPPIVIKSENKSEYITALQKADAGELEPFMLFLVKELQWSLDMSLKAARGESIEEPGDLDKRIELLKKQLNQKDIATKQISTHAVYEIVKNSVFPLFEIFEEKCEKLKNLFIDYDRRIMATMGGGGTQVQVGTKVTTWQQMISNWLEGQIVGHHQIINVIEYSFQLKGFKKSITQQYMSSMLHIQFNEFTYSIRINSNHSKTLNYSYDTILGETDINSIVTIMMDQLIDEISAAGGLRK